MVVNTELIERFLQGNRAAGIARLKLKSKLSHSLILLTLDGRVPGRASSREALAKAIGTTPQKLFPERKGSNA